MHMHTHMRKCSRVDRGYVCTYMGAYTHSKQARTDGRGGGRTDVHMHMHTFTYSYRSLKAEKDITHTYMHARKHTHICTNVRRYRSLKAENKTVKEKVLAFPGQLAMLLSASESPPPPPLSRALGGLAPCLWFRPPPSWTADRLVVSLSQM